MCHLIRIPAHTKPGARVDSEAIHQPAQIHAGLLDKLMLIHDPFQVFENPDLEIKKQFGDWYLATWVRLK